MKGPVYEIVGVAPDVSQMGLDSDPLPEIYFAFSQHASSAMVVMIRASGGRRCAHPRRPPPSRVDGPQPAHSIAAANGKLARSHA